MKVKGLDKVVINSIEIADNRELFKTTMVANGIPVPKSRKASDLASAIDAARQIGYPVIVRVAYTLGGQGSGVAFDEGKLKEIAQRGLAYSRIRQILVEEYLDKWKEVEYEVMRDHDDNCTIVCNMENMDPMGIHTGDSIVVAPSQTLTNREYNILRATAQQVIRALGIIGECNIQLAVDPRSEQFRVIEVNSRLSRSCALASKATVRRARSQVRRHGTRSSKAERNRPMVRRQAPQHTARGNRAQRRGVLQGDSRRREHSRLLRPRARRTTSPVRRRGRGSSEDG